MAKNTTTAKTPGVAIARVLRGLGLVQGADFRVKGEYRNGERVGTYVAILGTTANEIVAANADHVEELVLQDGGWRFNVSVRCTAGGTVWVTVANYGPRVREDVLQDDVPVAQADPYEGLHTTTVDGARWACVETGSHWIFQDAPVSPRYTLRFYRGLAQAVGWYVSGPGVDGDDYCGRTFRNAARLVASRLVDLEDIRTEWQAAGEEFPEGARVQGVDRHGVTCAGTVNGAGWGVVSVPGHANYGRAFVDITWDEMPHNAGTGRRSRPFTDELIRH